MGRLVLLAAAAGMLAACATEPPPPTDQHRCVVIPTGMVECVLHQDAGGARGP
jgi:hypothetical protein